MQTGLMARDGVRLAWRRRGQPPGSSPAVVLAHGLTDAAITWGEVETRLAASFDVISYDARGHGLSDRACDYSVAAHTADLIELVRAMHVVHPVLIGHSMGGVHSALAAAQLAPRAVVLEEPAWPEVAEDGTKDIAASRRSVVEIADLTESQRADRCRSEHPTWSCRDISAWVEARGQVDPDAVSWFGSWATTNRWREHIDEICCPGLLVTGDVDPTVTANLAAEASRLWPELQVRRIEGAGHNVRRDQFEPFWRVLADFLKLL